jgi:FKBP-type peptidyl-prolyl cis-trans isomerase 2
MKVSAGHIVRIACELRVAGGELIESSKKTGPIEYKHGSGQMLAGLESRIEGLSAGDEKSGVIPAAEAFGKVETQPRLSVPRTSFPADAKVEKGERFEAKGPNGLPVTLEIVSVDGDAVVARAVHPLAGKDVEFEVKVLAVRPPPPPVPKSPVEDLDLVEEPES